MNRGRGREIKKKKQTSMKIRFYSNGSVGTQMKTTCRTSSRKWRRKFVSVIALPYRAAFSPPLPPPSPLLPLSTLRCTVKTSHCPFGSIAYFLVRASRLTAPRGAGFSTTVARKKVKGPILTAKYGESINGFRSRATSRYCRY